MDLIGRHNEKKILDHCLRSKESKLVAVFGRRRVGKTYLIRKHLEKRIVIELTALHNADMKDQLSHFTQTINRSTKLYDIVGHPESWLAAFRLLEDFLDNLTTKGKKVIFFDELPWFETPKSKFLSAFENFWNGYCEKRKDLMVVICGSAASWMIKKIINNKGGLYNRVSEKIKLDPFSLHETEKFLKEKGIKWTRYDIIQLYMTTGGIPYYLDAIRKGESVTQFIDRCCFTKNGILTNEYENLFGSLFNDSERHYKIVKALYDKKIGLDRTALLEKSGLRSGGTFTTTIFELEESGFIESVTPYNGNKTKAQYKLIDPFILFHLRFMNSSKNTRWANMVNTTKWKSWAGLAFERLCFTHKYQIQKALSILGMTNTITTWLGKNKDQGAQIDMVIDRPDNVINVCEMKFYNTEFSIGKDYANKLKTKLNVFSSVPSNKKKSLFLTFITTYGIKKNPYYDELVQNELTMDDLFAS